MVINGVGNGIPFLKREGIPSSVRKSMVLWYDIKRQSTTNDIMVDNPKLIDLSGNGHDATCYNFAWSEMSGIGGYIQPKFTPSSGNYIVTPTYKFTLIPKEYGGSWILLFTKDVNYDKTKSWKIKVTCPDSPIQDKDNIYIFSSVNNENIRISKNIVDGEITIINPTDNKLEHIFLLASSKYNYAITIEMIPEYPNALVFDGIDDYCKVINVPILNDYTIIYKRKRFENKDDGCLFSKRVLSNTDNDGAFQIERWYSNGYVAFSFGNKTYILTKNQYINSINYQTKYKFNDVTLNIGKASDNTILSIGYLNANYISGPTYNGVLYSVILFNKTLSVKDINWVKHNLIEGDVEL